MRIYTNISTLCTPRGRSARRGPKEMSDVQILRNAEVIVGDDGIIQSVREAGSQRGTVDGDVIDCRGLLALPGFVDSHTHMVFLGERSLEFGMRASGRTYQDIAEAGGGIRSTVQQVGAATAREIADHSRKFVLSALGFGTTLLEIKSGYGLSTSSELALLEAARILGGETPMEIVRTFMGAHAIPDGSTSQAYTESVINDQLPAVVEAGLAEFCDVFCDCGYFTNEQTLAISEAAQRAGLKIKLHADELCDTGGAQLAAQLNAFSADHLLKINSDGIRALAASDRTVATLLPITALSIRSPYAPARSLIDHGAAVAVATDCNPGSSMSENMQLAFSLAVIGMQMTVEEALTATTLNGAAAIDRAETHGSLEAGKMCDMVLYDIPRLEYLPYHIGVSDLVSVVKRGEIVMGAML